MAFDRTVRGRSGVRPWGGGLAVLSMLVVAAVSGCGQVGGEGEGGQKQARLIEPGTSIGQAGTSPGRFSKPRAVDVMDGMLVVVDRSGRVQVMDPDSGVARAWFTLPDMERGFPTGVKVAVSPDGSGAQAIWLADTHNHRVSVYPAIAVSRDGPSVPRATEMEPVLRFGSYGQGPGEFIYPCDVAVLASEDGKRPQRVYVGEFGGSTDRVSIFDVRYEAGEGGLSKPVFGYVRSIGRGAGGQGGGEVGGVDVAGAARSSDSEGDAVELARPQQMLIDESSEAKAEVAAWLARRGEAAMTGAVRRGRLLVSDSIHHRLGVFDLEGRLMRWIGGETSGPATEGKTVDGGEKTGQFLHPRGMKLVGDGTLLVVEFGRNRVQHVQIATGKTLGVYGRGGSGRGELAEPWALAILDRTAFIVDARNNRLVRMRVP